MYVNIRLSTTSVIYVGRKERETDYRTVAFQSWRKKKKSLFSSVRVYTLY